MKTHCSPAAHPWAVDSADLTSWRPEVQALGDIGFGPGITGPGGTGSIGKIGKIGVGGVGDGGVGGTGMMGSIGDIADGDTDAADDVVVGGVGAIGDGVGGVGAGTIGCIGDGDGGDGGTGIIGSIGWIADADTGAGDGDAGAGGADVTVKADVGPLGNNWLWTTKLPVNEAGTVQFAERVIDCPGWRVRLTMYWGSPLEFDRQITLPFCVMKNPSTLGPSATVTLWFEVFFMVSCIWTTWPGLYVVWLVVRLADTAGLVASRRTSARCALAWSITLAAKLDSSVLSSRPSMFGRS